LDVVLLLLAKFIEEDDGEEPACAAEGENEQAVAQLLESGGNMSTASTASPSSYKISG
jgi:hypothetical protein